MRFRDQRVFEATIAAAAEQLDIDPIAVEKDYWVSEVLRGLAAFFPAEFVFKGGTSLSKAYRLVQRFSEDVDILVLPGERGRSATDTLMKKMGTVAGEITGAEPAKWNGAETGKHRAYRIPISARFPVTPLISGDVLLEMGVRGGSHPTEIKLISSLLGDALAAANQAPERYEDLAPFDVAVLHPGRTLVEKLVHVHALAQGLEADPHAELDGRSGRHFYDVWALLGDGQVLDFLADRDEFEGVLSNVEEVGRAEFGTRNLETRPPGGFATSPAFEPSSATSQRLRQAYESTTPELYFGEPPLPTWDEVCARIKERAELL